MSPKMNFAPMFYTLAQIKFNPIEQMANYVPQLQDALRRSGYPDFRSETQLALDVRRLDKEQPEVKSQQNIRWSFSNSQRTEGYLLLSNALVFHTTLYDSFDEFSEKLISGLNLIHELIRLAYIERIGLRYLNAIVPENDKELGKYLNPALLGFSAIINGSLKHNFTEIMTNVDNGTLVARAVIIEGGLAVPPDLSPLLLEIQPKFSMHTGRTGTLDVDYFVETRFDFDVQPVKSQLLKSHDVLVDTFRAAISDYAWEVWR